MHIGIDPGLSGAVAVLATDGTLQALYDTPVLTLRTSRGTRQEYDLPGLVALLGPYRGLQSQGLIEDWYGWQLPGAWTREPARGVCTRDRRNPL